ncbi:MAG: hemolysin, partial [Myxococcota bacterium]
NGTILELPVVADVDNDGQADIVVASNARYFSCNGTKTSGIRVLGSKNGGWVRTRGVWNQHAYHVTNVNEDGSIPAGELANWKQPGLNNFRQNKQPGQEFAAADLVVTLEPQCTESYGVVATVRNLGEAPVPAGATVTLYEGAVGAGTELGTESTTLPLFPAQAERLVFDLGTSAPGLQAGTTTASASVVSPAGVTECRPGNNDAPDTKVACEVPR